MALRARAQSVDGRAGVSPAPDVRTVVGPDSDRAARRPWGVLSRGRNAGVLGDEQNVTPPAARHGVPDVADRRQRTGVRAGDDGPPKAVAPSTTRGCCRIWEVQKALAFTSGTPRPVQRSRRVRPFAKLVPGPKTSWPLRAPAMTSCDGRARRCQARPLSHRAVALLRRCGPVRPWPCRSPPTASRAGRTRSTRPLQQFRAPGPERGFRAGSIAWAVETVTRRTFQYARLQGVRREPAEIGFVGVVRRRRPVITVAPQQRGQQ